MNMHEMLIQSGLAFLEGLGLVFSPCILPVLPLILAGGATGDRRKPFGIITGFVLSFTVFALLSRQLFSASGLDEELVRRVSFALLAVLGVVMLVPFLEERFTRLTQGLANKAQGVRSGDGFGGGVVMGLLIGVVWTPCAGPILAAALLQVIRAKTSFDAISTVTLFSLGAAIPMLVIALSGKALAQKLGTHTVAIRRGMGAVLVVFAGLGLAGINIGTLVDESAAPAQIADSEGLLRGLEAPYPAPELATATHWINSPPLTLAGLKGKVVLVDFWTYSCINCLRTLPYVRAWYEKYHDKGLEIIGVHAPEFAFENKIPNVEAAVRKYDVRYPVMMDNAFHTWDRFKNQYWPAHYLIDRDGKVVYTHFGEGKYEVTEHNIRYLLGLAGEGELVKAESVVATGQTPETYLGTARAAREWTGAEGEMPLHGWSLSGAWERSRENIEAKEAGASLELKFQAKKVFLVMSGPNGEAVDVAVSTDAPANAAADLADGRATVTEDRLYEIVSLPEAGEGTVTITAQAPGLRVYAFTFESGAPAAE